MLLARMQNRDSNSRKGAMLKSWSVYVSVRQRLMGLIFVSVAASDIIHWKLIVLAGDWETVKGQAQLRSSD